MDGRQRRVCYRHASADELRLVDRLDDHAPEIGLRRSGEWAWGAAYAWPYGANVDVGMRARLLAWAIPRELRLSPRACGCPLWLARGRSCDFPRRAECRLSGGVFGPRPGNTIGDGYWVDHVTSWTRNGRPAAIVSQPYSFTDASRAEVEHVADLFDLEWEVEGPLSGGDACWYGLDAWAVVLTTPAVGGELS